MAFEMIKHAITLKNALTVVILLSILICIPSQLTSAQADSSNKYAVIIANDSKQCVPVNGANCARVLQSILREAGFPQKNIKLLLNHQATAEAVQDALLWLQQVGTADSEVVFAFFGHGSSNTILLSNLYLWHEALRDWLAPIQSEKQLVIIDSCHSGGAIIEGNDDVTLCAPHRIVVTSCRSELDDSLCTQKYTEWVERFLIEGIKCDLADSNGDGLVSIQEAFVYDPYNRQMFIGLMCDNYGQEFFF